MKFLTPFTCNLFSLYLVAEHEDDWAAAFYFTLRSASVRQPVDSHLHDPDTDRRDMSASGSGAAAALGTAITAAGLGEALHGTAPGIRSSGRMAVSGKRTADHTNREPSSIRMTASAMASETEGFDRGGLAEHGERGPTVVADTHNVDRAGLSATLKSGAPADEDGPVPRVPRSWSFSSSAMRCGSTRKVSMPKGRGDATCPRAMPETMFS